MKEVPCAFLLALGLSGCSRDIQTVKSLENQLAELEVKVATLASDMNQMNITLQGINIEKMIEGVVYLKADSNRYQEIKTGLGSLTVSLEDVKPYASGSKVMVKFGNPLSATIAECKCTLEWGSLDEKGRPSGQQKTKDFECSKPILAGSWSTLDVILEGSPPEKFGYLRIKDFSVSSISLSYSK